MLKELPNRISNVALLANITTLLVCVTWASPSGRQVDQPDARVTFRAGVETIVVHVTARDRTGRLVTTLERTDFNLSIDDRAVPIEAFSKEQQALTVGILLHPGYPVTSVARIRDIGSVLVDSLETRDQAFIGTFALEIAFSPFATSNRDILHRVLREEVWPAHNANLVGNAVDTALRLLPTGDRKRALVIVGDDSAQTCGIAPCIDENIARRHAVEQAVVVYGIVVRNAQRAEQLTGYPVERMAAATGGGYFHIDRESDVDRVSRVIQELRLEYLLGFTPRLADGRSHSLDVRIAQRGVRAKARLGSNASPVRSP